MGWRGDLALAALAALAILILFALGGFSGFRNGDNDSIMRLVQVRDLIGGQDWFDLRQYRMGAEGGIEMHWSRIVDAPIAAILLVAGFVTGDVALAESVTLHLWPLMLCGAAIFLILRCAQRFGGDAAVVPALFVGAITLYFLPAFGPGALDHHNVQLVLTLAVAALMLADAADRVAAYGAGASAALMLAVGMEALPYVALGGLCAAASFLLFGRQEAGRAARFGAAFGLVSLAAFLVTVEPDEWLRPHCDAFSVAQLSVAALAGFGLCAAALVPASAATFRCRLVSLAMLGAVAGAVAVLIFPQCLQGPYAALDPRLHLYWMGSISETRSAIDLLLDRPALFAGYYVTPLLALALLAGRMRRSGLRRQDAILGSLLATATLVSLWQVRGAMFSLPLAVPVLAAWVAEWRTRSNPNPTLAASLKLAGVWAASLHIVWYMAVAAPAALLEDGAPDNHSNAAACYDRASYEELAALQEGTVASISNLGASILAYTPHRALAGPYHRNVEGNIAALDVLAGDDSRALAALQRLGVDYLAFCPGNAETRKLAALAPHDLAARLLAGDAPDWLQPIGDADVPLRLFRVAGSAY